MSKLSNMKFRISSPEQSERLQRVLFSLGYGFNIRNKQIKYTDADHLFCYENGSITVSYGDYGFGHDNTEQNTEEFIAKHSNVPVMPVEVVKKPVEREIELVSVLGKLYKREALETVLSDLETFTVKE